MHKRGSDILLIREKAQYHFHQILGASIETNQLIFLQRSADNVSQNLQELLFYTYSLFLFV